MKYSEGTHEQALDTPFLHHCQSNSEQLISKTVTLHIFLLECIKFSSFECNWLYIHNLLQILHKLIHTIIIQIFQILSIESYLNKRNKTIN